MISLQESQETRLSNLTAYPLSGSCQGRFALHLVPSDFLSSLLPPGLILAQQPYAPEGFHPLMLMFNLTHLHSNIKLPELAQKAGLGLNLTYNEFIVMLPFVRLNRHINDPQTNFCYLPVLYLDSLLAVMGGRVFWEFNKIPAHFYLDDNRSITIKSEVLDETYFTAAFSPPEKSSPARDNPNFIALEPILNLPVIEFGLEGYVTSVYRIAYEQAVIQPCTTSVDNIRCEYFPKGKMDIPSLYENVMGAFYMNYDWDLTWAKKI